MAFYNFFLVPKPKFKVGELVVVSRNTPIMRLESSCGEVKLFSNGSEDRDYLFHIDSRRYGKCTGDTEKKWYYSGNELEYKQTTSKSLTQVPIFSTGVYNISEDKLKRLEDILVKE